MDFIFQVYTEPVLFIFEVEPEPVNFIFSIPNIIFGGGAVGGIIRVFVNGVLDQTITTADYSTEVINID